MPIDVAQIVRSAWPLGRHGQLRLLDKSWNSLAVAIDDMTVAKLARDPEGSQKLALEQRVLGLLRQMALEVPRPLGLFNAPAGSRWTMTFQSFERGRIANWRSVDDLQGILEYLGSFHRRTSEIQPVDAGRIITETRASEAIEARLLLVRQVALEGGLRIDLNLRKFVANLGTEELEFCHGDCKFQHFLIRTGSDSTICAIDFGDVLICNRAADYAGLLLDAGLENICLINDLAGNFRWPDRAFHWIVFLCLIALGGLLSNAARFTPEERQLALDYYLTQISLAAEYIGKELLVEFT